MLGDEYSTITFLPAPMSDEPKASPFAITSFTTSSMNASLDMNILTYALTLSTFSNISSDAICSAIDFAIKGGAFLSSFASLKHGNA